MNKMKIIKDRLRLRQSLSAAILEAETFEDMYKPLRIYVAPDFAMGLKNILIQKNALTVEARDNLVKGMKTLNYEIRGIMIGLMIYESHPKKEAFIKECEIIYNFPKILTESHSEYAKRFLMALVLRTETIIEKALKRCERALY